MTDSAREHSRFAAIFAGGTMASRVLGLLRDLAMNLLPLSSREAFIVAFRFPNMLRDLIGEGATNAAFVPVFTEAEENEGKAALQRLVAASMGAMLVVLGVTTLLGMLLMPYVLEHGISLLQPISQGDPKSPGELALMANLTFWVFPYLFLIGMAVFATGPLYTLGKYGVASWSPALLNIALIGACLFLRDAFPEPAYALVAGVWIGGVAQMLALYVAMGRASGVWRPSLELNHPGVRNAFILLVPVLIGQSAGEMNKLVDTFFAAGLGNGPVDALYYANRFVQLPLAVFGIATSVAILPSLSRAGARGDADGVRTMLASGLLRCAFLVLPAMVGMVLLATPIMELLFGHGAVTPELTAMRASALVFYGAGLLSFALVKVAVAGFYAVKDTRTPVVIASASMVLNIALNMALVRPMGYKGLALATTISFTVNLLLLLVFFRRRFGALLSKAFGARLAKIVAAATAMGLCVWATYEATLGLPLQSALAAETLLILIPIAAGVVSYAAASHLLRIEEFATFRSLLRRK